MKTPSMAGVAIAAFYLASLHGAAATSLDDQLLWSYKSCYSATGVSCTCTEIVLVSKSLTGSIASALSACTGLTSL